jgi:hypothetical protein
MKSWEIFAAAIISSICAFGVAAEEYTGVQAPTSALKREDVNAEAVAAASAPDQNIPAAARPHGPLRSPRDRAVVQAEAERAAAAPDQNISASSRVNSRVISTMENPVDVRARARDPGSANSTL